MSNDIYKKALEDIRNLGAAIYAIGEFGRAAADAVRIASTALGAAERAQAEGGEPSTNETKKLARVLRGIGGGGNAPDDLWETDQPDGDPFVLRAAELLEQFAANPPAKASEPMTIDELRSKARSTMIDAAIWQGKLVEAEIDAMSAQLAAQAAKDKS